MSPSILCIVVSPSILCIVVSPSILFGIYLANLRL
jgi:hypothetical protein